MSPRHAELVAAAILVLLAASGAEAFDIENRLPTQTIEVVVPEGDFSQTIGPGANAGCHWSDTDCNPTGLRDANLTVDIRVAQGHFRCVLRMKAGGYAIIDDVPRTDVYPTLPPDYWCQTEFEVTPGNTVVTDSRPGGVFDTRRDVHFLATADPQFSNGQPERRDTALDTLGAMMGRIGAERSLRGMVVAGDLTQNSRIYDEYAAYLYGIRQFPHMVFDGIGNHDDMPPTLPQFLACGVMNDTCVKPVAIREEIAARYRGTRRTFTQDLHYSWDWHDVHFVQLNMFPGDDCDIGCESGDCSWDASLQFRDGCQVARTGGTECCVSQGQNIVPRDSLAFLQADLATFVGGSGRPVVLVHHFGYDGFTTDPDDTWWPREERVAYWRLLENYNVIAMISGHSEPDPTSQFVSIYRRCRYRSDLDDVACIGASQAFPSTATGPEIPNFTAGAAFEGLYLDLRLTGPPDADRGYYDSTLDVHWLDQDGNELPNFPIQRTFSSLRDAGLPRLLGVPRDERASCDSIPPPASPRATDAEDPIPVVTFAEARVNGPCADRYQLVRTWTARDRSWNETSDRQTVDVVDDVRPTLVSVPPDQTVECDAIPGAPHVAAFDSCDPDPIVTLVETTTAGCGGAYTVLRTWTARDRCGNQEVATRTLTVVDRTPPALAGVPSDVTVACDAVPPFALVTATDACDPMDVRVTPSQVRTDGSCPQSYALRRTWSAVDACGNVAAATQVVTVVDATPPVLVGVPAPVTVECNAVPVAAVVGAVDACDAAPGVAFDEVRVDGRCPGEHVLVRTWTATDACGNARAGSQRVTVVDTTPPVLEGVPAPVTVECDAVPPPAVVGAVDACDAVPVVAFGELRVDGRCPGEHVLVRTWTATDWCGNARAASQVVTVVDTTPPVVTASEEDLYCLWPPDGGYACFDLSDFAPGLREACSGPVTWRFTDCAADGDVGELDDCVVRSDGGAFCVRARRGGGEVDGRRYRVTIVAEDACGNAASPGVIGAIRVPHDRRRGRPECLRMSEVGCRPGQPPFCR
jgi:hypothetical protein